MVAALALPAAVTAQSPGAYAGLYDTSFGAGLLGIMVRADGAGVVLAFDTADDVAYIDKSVAIASDGSMSSAALGGVTGGSFNAQFSFADVSGTLSVPAGDGAFTASRRNDSGPLADQAGYYTGTYTGTCHGASAGGTVDATLAADGTVVWIFHERTEPGSVPLGFRATANTEGVFQRPFTSNQDVSTSLLIFGFLSASGPSTGVWESDAPGNCERTVSLTRQIALVPRPDTDRDGVPDIVDNCPLDANANQANANGDRYGDACEYRRANSIVPLISTIILDED